MERKWYNFETPFVKTAERLHDFLQDQNFKHEVSAVMAGYHFEILLNAEEVQAVESFLQS